MIKLKDGQYEVEYSTEYDRGYGVESAADEVVITVENGQIAAVDAYGIHFVSELDCEWPVDELENEEAIELILDKYPDALR